MPIGDGQKISLKISINSKTYQNYSFNFIESYLFGKKNNSLKINLLYSFNNSDDGILKTFGLIFGISKKLKLFNFVLNNHLSYFFYFYKNFKLLDNKKKFTGTSSNLNFSFSIISNSIDNFIYPKNGFFLNFSSKITPPYSLFKKEIMNFEKLIEFKNIEYHQWIISFSCFNKIFKNLVLNTKFFLGFLGRFSHNSHISPFERFYLGGNKMSHSRGFINSKFVSLRGYSDNSITPVGKYFGGILRIFRPQLYVYVDLNFTSISTSTLRLFRRTYVRVSLARTFASLARTFASLARTFARGP